MESQSHAVRSASPNPILAQPLCPNPRHAREAQIRTRVRSAPQLSVCFQRHDHTKPNMMVRSLPCSHVPQVEITLKHWRKRDVSARLRRTLLLACLALPIFAAAKKSDLWVLQPVARPTVPAATPSANPIDAFIAAQYKAKGLRPAAPAGKLTLLRRVYLDLIGIPPTPAEQDAFLADAAPDAYEKVVDRLLASDQHGVRYARHWLDILRYADADERMPAAPGIYL